MKDTVYKVFKIEEWEKYLSTGTFQGSDKDLEDGFIHLATVDQLEHVLNTYFLKDKTIISSFKSKDFGNDLKWEDGFPHLYNQVLDFDRKIEKFAEPINISKLKLVSFDICPYVQKSVIALLTGREFYYHIQC